MVLAVQDVLGIEDENTVKAASGLSGGFGRMSDLCGALVGAGMVLGLKYGRGRKDIANLDKLAQSAMPVGKIYKWFEKEFGSVRCRDIRTRFAGGVLYDMNVPWQAELAGEAGVHEKCTELTARTAAKAAEMLWEAID